MDIRKVKSLIELLEASDVAEIEIKEGDESVALVARLFHPPQLFKKKIPLYSKK